MPKLTPEAQSAWQNRERRMVLTTVDKGGKPNAIWLLCAEFMGDDKIVLANNSMSKTLENIEDGCRASLLYIAPEREAYQIKGRIEHHPSGPVFDHMKTWLNPQYPGLSAVLLHIDELHYGAQRLV